MQKNKKNWKNNRGLRKNNKNESWNLRKRKNLLRKKLKEKGIYKSKIELLSSRNRKEKLKIRQED